MYTKKKYHLSLKEYEGRVKLSVQLNRWILEQLGAWPKNFKIPLYEKLLSNFQKIFCYLLLALLVVPSGLYVLFEEKDTYHRIKLMGPISFSLMAILKYNSLILHQNDIRTCVEHIQADWKRIGHIDDDRIMTKNADFGRRLIIIYASFMYSSAIFYYVILPISTGKVRGEGNLTFRPLVCPVAKFLVDTRVTPANEFFFIGQCMSGILMHSITVATCSLAAVLVMHACGQLEVLKSWLESMVDGREDRDKDVGGRLAEIVEHHVRILSFVSLTEKVLQQISLVEVTGCTLHMCLIGYHILMEWEHSEASSATYFILFISITFNVFIFCYIGELISEQCEKLNKATYMVDWYRLPEKKGLDLKMVMAMSNNTIKLSAGNLIVLSLSSFGDVVKTSLAYLNMLRTLTL